ncbi:putative membrane-associated kinase regulator 1 [Platanthera zijinensis]|uniref:Membrane-associated kinase regulator 1 n=1 Tax=Platanthera zijinensis TaxID=2320716 RepID=A0AAP0AX78_9ASPA
MRDSNGRGGTLRTFPSPSSASSSSSSDFEFTICHSPSWKHPPSSLCPADELFYKGQLLPLHLSPRLSMVRTLLASSSTSSDSTSTSRDSNGSSSSSTFSNETLPAQVLPEPVLDCDDSSRRSFLDEEDARRRPIPEHTPKRSYLSSFTTRFSSVFLHRGNKRDPSFSDNVSSSNTLSKGASLPIPITAKKSTIPPSSAKEKLKKYVKKVKPLYEKLSPLQHKQSQPPQQRQKKTFSFSIRREREPSTGLVDSGSTKRTEEEFRCAAAGRAEILSQAHSFSWRKRCPASCPSSMRSSPSRSCLLSLRAGGTAGGFPPPVLSSNSSMEELQSAIQGAIAHCKNTMTPANLERPSPE